MRLLKMGLSMWVGIALSCALFTATVFTATAFTATADAAAQRGEFAASESTMMGNTFVDARAERFAASLVPEFPNQRAAPAERIHLAYAPTPMTHPMRSSAQATALVPQVAEQPPSFWLMGAVALFLIAYQLRRKHRLLRPHRFHEL